MEAGSPRLRLEQVSGQIPALVPFSSSGSYARTRGCINFLTLRSASKRAIQSNYYSQASLHPRCHLSWKEYYISDVRVTSNLGFVSEADVATWFSAANVVVLPYRKVLNSGSMMLAATFGVPLVLPADELLLADYGDEAWIRFFDPSRAAESIAELLDGDWYLQSGTIEAAMRIRP